MESVLLRFVATDVSLIFFVTALLVVIGVVLVIGLTNYFALKKANAEKERWRILFLKESKLSDVEKFKYSAISENQNENKRDKVMHVLLVSILAFAIVVCAVAGYIVFSGLTHKGSEHSIDIGSTFSSSGFVRCECSKNAQNGESGGMSCHCYTE